MKFDYQARLEDGQIQLGVVEAQDKESAVILLQKHGLYVSYIEEQKTSSILSKEISFFEKTKRKDIVLFSRQLSIMFKSGVPIVESLKSIAKQTNKKFFREEILEIAKKVEEGNSLSQALSVFPKLFAPFYIGMVKSGEVSGRLPEVLEYLAEHLEKEYEFNNKIISAMIYPVFVLFVFFGVLFFMTIFVIPRIGDIFEGMDLPFATRIVMKFSDFLINQWWVLLTLLIALIFSFTQFIKSKKGKKTFEGIIFKIPLLGDFVKKINLVRIAENFSTLIAGGLPIVQAIEVTANIVGSETYKEAMAEVKEGVRRGELISSILSRYPEYFPSLFIQMIVVGEKTGNIDSSLKNVVLFYQGDIDRSFDGMIKLLEPIMIIFMGALVGFFIVAMLLPIYQIAI